MIEMARFTAPLCKGSCRRKPTEGLFFTTRLGDACKSTAHTRKFLRARDLQNRKKTWYNIPVSFVF